MTAQQLLEQMLNFGCIFYYTANREEEMVQKPKFVKLTRNAKHNASAIVMLHAIDKVLVYNFYRMLKSTQNR